MTREEQDKNWALLSEESKYHYQTEYKNRLEDSKREIEDPEGGGDLTVLTSQYIVKDLEKIFGKHNLQPKPLTYEDVAKELFKDKKVYFGFDESNYEYEELTSEGAIYALNCTTFKQFKKLCAINKLLNVAKFLNKNEDGSDWVPDFDDENSRIYTFGVDPTDNSVMIIRVNNERVPTEIVYFRRRAFISQAVEILGEDVVRSALTTDY